MAAPKKPRAAPAKNAPPPFQWASITSCGTAVVDVTVSTGNAPAVDVFTAPSVVVMASMAAIGYEMYLRIVTSFPGSLSAKGDCAGDVCLLVSIKLLPCAATTIIHINYAAATNFPR